MTTNVLEPKAAGKNACGPFICPRMRIWWEISDALHFCHRGRQVVSGWYELRCVLDWVSPVRTESQGQEKQDLSGSSLLNRANSFKGLHLLSPRNQLHSDNAQPSSTSDNGSGDLSPYLCTIRQENKKFRKSLSPLYFWIEGGT